MTQLSACILRLWGGKVRGRQGIRGKGERKKKEKEMVTMVIQVSEFLDLVISNPVNASTLLLDIERFLKIIVGKNEHFQTQES